MLPNQKKWLLTLTLSLTLFLICFILALLIGAETINPLVLFQSAPDPAAYEIMLYHRLPRLLIGSLTGAALAGCGLSFQVLLRNPLADPYILGVSGGAALGGTIAIALGIADTPLGISSIQLFSFLGALLTLTLVFALSRRNGQLSAYHLLLIGVIFNGFAAALILFLKSVLRTEQSQELLFWLMGTLSFVDFSYFEILVTFVFVATGFVLLLKLSKSLNVLSLGEESALPMGVNPERVKQILFVSSSLMVGAVVSLTGLIGFVGLVIPHMIRLIIGPDHRLLIPAAAFVGAAFLIMSDAFSRLFFNWLGTEIPVGVITAFVGGPLFVLILKRQRLREW